VAQSVGDAAATRGARGDCEAGGMTPSLAPYGHASNQPGHDFARNAKRC